MSEKVHTVYTVYCKYEMILFYFIACGDVQQLFQTFSDCLIHKILLYARIIHDSTLTLTKQYSTDTICKMHLDFSWIIDFIVRGSEGLYLLYYMGSLQK
jgi:hypothetical protein